MPIDYSKYPVNWKKIRARILARAGHKCEWCGVPNKAIGARDKHDRWWDVDDLDCLNSDVGYSYFGDYPKLIQIVLTCAHLDHNPESADESRIALLCQRCHLRYDTPIRVQHAAETRRRKRLALQPALFDA